MERVGLIAGATQFPLLVAREAKALGYSVVAVGIEGETLPELSREVDEMQVVALGELSRLISVFKTAGVRRAVMAGKVQHASIFRAIKPDLKLLAVLMKLREKNTDAIIGAVAKVLEDEGITLMDSTVFLKALLAPGGVMTRRRPDSGEMKSIEYGVRVARELTRLDIGQTVVVKDGACVAVEAMEGTDETIRRAHGLCGEGAVVVKLSKPAQDFRFDVPVCGLGTIEAMAATGAKALAIEAGRTLVFDRERVVEEADGCGIAIVGVRV